MSTTRFSSPSSRNWWRGRSCARASSSTTSGTGAPRPARNGSRAWRLILTGFVKKLIFADQFALVADQYFANPAALPGLLPAWTGTIAFALQIFFDFSGYTDIAIGVALLFGFHFPENFRRPYLSASITEFWRRWHMTLSRWLRDYIYISLGGNRRGALRTYLNLLLTMLLGGLWHGASWNFVIWGGYHGVLLAIERMVWGRREHTGLRADSARGSHVSSRLHRMGVLPREDFGDRGVRGGTDVLAIPGTLAAHPVAMAHGDLRFGRCTGGGISRTAFTTHCIARVGANCRGDCGAARDRTVQRHGTDDSVCLFSVLINPEWKRPGTGARF